MITVDDGYQDFYTEAFPIIKRYRVPVTVFLTIDFIDKQIWLWHDLLNYAITNTARAKFDINGNHFNLRTQQGRREFKLSLDIICTSLDTSKRDNFIHTILHELDVKVPANPTANYAPLGWSCIKEMSRFGISFGAHTCTHPILSRIPPEHALIEIKESKRRLEEVIQKDVLAFCYPNGKETDFNRSIKEKVKQSGFKCAMSMIYGMNDSRSDPYALKRIGLDGRSFLHFIYNLSGFGVLRISLRRFRLRSC
jgi:peptidoglycan/xylan/chitin deacetylase (PgdA/CDA1 family)